jgi:type IX secretion system PorP/SprF family membrane protein
MSYSQYVFNTLAINPAYAGYKEALNAHVFTRLQWMGVDGTPKIYSAIVDGVAAGRNVGWGGQFAMETLGPYSVFSAYGTYAYRLSLNTREDRLTFGLSAGLSYQQIDRNKLQAYDPTSLDYWAYVNNLTSEARPDFRFGVYYDTPFFYAGLSVTNIFANFTYAKRIPHMYLTAGGLITLSESVSLKPTMLIREDFKGPTNGDVNLFAIFIDRIWVGAGYRTGIPFKGNLDSIDKLSATNAVAFITEFYVTPSLRVGYSYDHNLNGWPSTHEIGVSYTVTQRFHRSVTPRFF